MSIAWNTVARTAEGQAVLAATLDNGHGLRARAMNYGADSPHHPAFPSTLLRPGGAYRHSTLFRFSADDGPLV